jgi:hypothetical protein
VGGGGQTKSITLLEGFQASSTGRSGISAVKVKKIRSFNLIVNTKIHTLKRKFGGLQRKGFGSDGFKSGRMRNEIN